MYKKASDSKTDTTKMVVYGKSNTGKTSLVRTIRKDKVLIVDAEKQGLDSIDDLATQSFRLYEDSTGKAVPRHKRYERLQKFLTHIVTPEGRKEGFKWLVFDSISEISQNIMEAEKYAQEQKKANGEKVNNFELWGNYKEKMIGLLKDLRDIVGYNVLCLALVDEVKNEDGIKEQSVEIEGNSCKQRVPAIFSQCFYMYVDPQGERKFITSSTNGFIAKDRSRKTEKIEPADIDHIIKKIKG